MKALLLLLFFIIPAQAQSWMLGRQCSSPSCAMCNRNHELAIMRFQPVQQPIIKPAFVPTPMSAVKDLVRLAQPKHTDIIYDPGCGDGRLLIALCRDSGARGVGFDLNPATVRLARKKVREAGLESRIIILQADSRKMDLSEATLVVCYLNPKTMQQLKLCQSSQVLSYQHSIPGMHGEKWGDWWYYGK